MSCYWLVALAALSISVSQSASAKPASEGPAAAKPAPQANADRPDAEPELLPAPRPLAPAMTIHVLPSLPPQLGTREVWQYYGVDRSGRFLPRVIQSPYGAYYLYNGRPFPWTTTRPSSHMPYALD